VKAPDDMVIFLVTFILAAIAYAVRR